MIWQKADTGWCRPSRCLDLYHWQGDQGFDIGDLLYASV